MALELCDIPDLITLNLRRFDRQFQGSSFSAECRLFVFVVVVAVVVAVVVVAVVVVAVVVVAVVVVAVVVVAVVVVVVVVVTGLTAFRRS